MTINKIAFMISVTIVTIMKAIFIVPFTSNSLFLINLKIYDK